MKIAVAGTGYVGLSIATLLAQHNAVTAVDIVPEKVDLLNRRKSPIQDEYIEKYLAEKELDLTATARGSGGKRHRRPSTPPSRAARRRPRKGEKKRS